MKKLLVIIFLLLYSVSYANQHIPYLTGLILSHAQRLMKEGKYDAAIRLLNRFKQKHKKEAENYLVDFTFGNCFFMKKAFDKAAKYYSASVKKNPKFSSAWINLAQCLYSLKKYKASAKAFIKAYNTSSKKEPEYLYYASICFLSAGEYKKSINLLKKLISSYKNPKIKWKEAIAHAYILCKAYKKALPFVEELSEIEKGRKKIRWQQLRLHLYMILNMDQKALLYAERLVREDPTNPKWWKGLAHFYLKKDDYTNALCALIIKGFLVPLTEEEQKIVAQLSAAVGIPRQALLFYKKLAKKKTSFQLIYQIAQCYIRIHRPSDALSWVDKGLSLYPKASKLLLLKAELLYQLGHYKKAAVLFKKCAKAGISPGRCWLMSGYAYLSAGEIASAIYSFRQAKKYPKQKANAIKALSLCLSMK